MKAAQAPASAGRPIHRIARSAESGNAASARIVTSRSSRRSETFPSGQAGFKTVRTYGYDNGKRLLTRTVTTAPASGLNEITTYGYDLANRLTSRTYNDGKGNDGFTYDTASRLLTAVSGRFSATVTRVYTGGPRETLGRGTGRSFDQRRLNSKDAGREEQDF